MASGKKTGGRMRGTPNKRTLDIQVMLDRLGCNPLEGMAKLAMNEATPIEIRARMYAELAQYIAPKRRSAEVQTTTDSRVVFNIGIPRRDISTRLMPVQEAICDASVK